MRRVTARESAKTGPTGSDAMSASPGARARVTFASALASLVMASVPPAQAASLGRVEAGRLEGARALAVRGDHHYILPRRHRGRGLRYGTPGLVALLLEAAAGVAQRFPGSRLALGNLSRKRGGAIRYSKSHQSGRDADVAFYMTDRRGRPLSPRDLVRFDRRGRSRRGHRFDLARNWALIESLVSSPHAEVQWLLISAPLRERLLDYGRSTGAPLEVLKRAADTLHQPRWALPHDDHLHVRVYCAREDVSRGCKDTGPRWTWVRNASASASAPASTPSTPPLDPPAPASMPDGSLQSVD